MAKIHLVIVVAVALAVACHAVAQQSEPPDAELDRLVRAVSGGTSAEEADKAAEKLFKGADLKKLERLKQVKEEGVALRAAWKEVLLGGTPRAGKHPIWGSVKIVDRAAAARFLGFVEGRLGVSMPKWWESCVIDAYRFDQHSTIYPGETDSPYHLIKQATLFCITDGVSRKLAEGKTVLSSGNDEIVLAPEIADKYVKHTSNLSVLIEHDYYFLAPHDSAGSSFPLICIHRSSGRKAWESKVWGYDFQGFSTGPAIQYVSVVAKSERVFVFGSGDAHFCIEAFDRKTGRNEFRFRHAN